MTPKFCIFFAFLLINSQNIFASNLLAIERSLLEDAQKAVKNLDTIVNKQVKQSIDTVTTTRNNLETFAKSTLTTADKLLQSTIKTSLNEIKAIEDNAKVHGIDISSCTKDKVDIIKNLPVSVGNVMQQNVTSNITESIKITKKAIDQINSLTSVVTKLENKLAGCAVGIVGMECYMEVLSEATTQVSNLPQKIVSLEIKAINDIDGIKSNIIVATIVAANNAEVFATQLTQTITECANALE